MAATAPSLECDAAAPRKAANLSVNSDLLRLARELGVNLSRELERRLQEIVAEERRKLWLAENESAIAAYNDHIERSGTFSEGVRRF